MKPPDSAASSTDLKLRCWCGATEFGQTENRSYAVCNACGTAVIREPTLLTAKATDSVIKETYSEEFWNRRQTEVGLPSVEQRARLDLPERCLYWLSHILRYCSPPGRVLEVGCAHGALVKLLDLAGFHATGMEMDRGIVQKARAWFDIDVLEGPVESLPETIGTFDVVVLLDVLEHLPQPVETVQAIVRLLKPDGVLVIQSPEYQATRERSWSNFVVPEHLYLFTKKSVSRLLRDVGLAHIHFEESTFLNDFFLFSSAQPLTPKTTEGIERMLCSSGNGRIVLAMLDLGRDDLKRRSSSELLGNLSGRFKKRLCSLLPEWMGKSSRH